MIFSETWESVLDGSKTETTRLRPGRYQVGRRYAVQPGRGKKGLGFIVIDAVGECLLLERLSYFRAEGFVNDTAFAGALLRVNGALDSRQRTWWYRFHLAEER